MKICFLNTWGGRRFAPLLDFISTLRDGPTLWDREYDVICLQEVLRFPEASSGNRLHTVGDSGGHEVCLNLYEQLCHILEKKYDAYFSPAVRSRISDSEEIPHKTFFGIAMFIRKKIPVVAFREDFIWRTFNAPINGEPAPRTMQCATLEIAGQEIVVGHFHGVWGGSKKTDSVARATQTVRVRGMIDMLRHRTLPVILGGDMNLDISHQSLDKLCSGLSTRHESGRNLIKEFDIHDTRTSLYPQNKETRYADYILVSPDVKVMRLSAPNIEISDHTPLLGEFSFQH